LVSLTFASWNRIADWLNRITGAPDDGVGRQQRLSAW
jgi:hypothetical protein